MSNVTQLQKKLEKDHKRQKTIDTHQGDEVIFYQAGKIPEIVDEIETILAASDELNIFVHAERMVRIYPNEKPSKGVNRSPGAPIIHPVESAHLSEIIGRASYGVRWDAKAGEYVACDPPRRIAETFLSRGYWPKLRKLSGFVECPTISPEGRLIDTKGYDEGTGLFLTGDIPGYIRPKDQPSIDDGKAAIERLKDLISTFPFVDLCDLSAALASILTAPIRRSLPAAPMIGFTAPTPATGKTTLAETPSMLVTGRRASVMAIGYDEAEQEKRLAGILMAGDSCIMLDNIERPLRGDLLCQATSQPFVRVRPLGGSGMCSIPTHALLLATGNNLQIHGDLKRRVVLVRLDARQERPEQREFARDHLGYVTENRGQIIHDVLTVILAYYAAGTPRIEGLTPYGSFEQWDRMVRRPLVWLGLPDPLQASESLRDMDPDLESTRLLFSAWYTELPERPMTAAEVVEAGRSELGNPNLHEALHLVCRDKVTGMKLGAWLKQHKDRIVDGLTLKHTGQDGHKKVAQWRVTRADFAGVAKPSPAIEVPL